MNRTNHRLSGLPPLDARPRRRSVRSLAALLGAAIVGLVLWGPASVAQAQRPLQQVLDLNRQAMESYQMLELEQAQQLLEQAQQVAERGNVSGAALARTYLNLGVVAVGGFGDNGRGLNFFIQAIQADGSIELDPLTSTPEISTVFALARSRAGAGGGNQGGGNQGGGNQGGGNQGGGNQGGGNQGGGNQGGGAGNLQHMAVPEQLAQTAVPIYIEVPNNPAHVYVFYRGHGMREFNRQEMVPVAGGYGFEIPCTDVFQPGVEYYIVAFGNDGSPIGFAGTQNEPITVNIVNTRTQPAPALPGQAPPETCGETECPPGMAGCAAGGGTGGMGASCRSNSDCGSGLVCDDDLCITGDRGSSGGGGGGDGDMPRFFLHVGGTLSLPVVGAGMQADTCPPSVPRGDPVTDAQCGVNPGPEEAYIEGGMGPCGFEAGQYCVRVAQGGVVPNGAIRVAAGGYFLPFLGVAAFARFQPASGHGDFSFFLLGLRVQAQLTEPAATGLNAHVFVGTSVGQIQAQPPGNGDNAPYIISGLNGIHFGGILGYRILKHFGVYLQADFMFQFPTFMYNTDISLGLETGF